MKRIKLLLGFIQIEEPTAEFIVSAELTKLTKRAPRTKAERGFALWLQAWQEQNARVVKGGK
jgi:hypothetical protein